MLSATPPKRLRLALLLLPWLCLAPPVPAQDRTPGYLTLEKLGQDIALSLRWLRAQQDPQTGAFGNVELTCKVLTAFVESPSHYGYEDGPFVSRAVDYLLSRQRKDGAICEPNAIRLLQRNQTAACIETLPYFAEVPGVTEALERARSFTGIPSSDASWQATLADVSDQEIFKRAEEVLAGRKPEGYWEHPTSLIQGAAMYTEHLCGFYMVLESRRQPLMGAPPALPATATAERAQAEEAQRRGAAFLAGVATDGGYGPARRPDVELTARVAQALLVSPEPRDKAVDEAAAHALDWLASQQRPDGSIQAGGDPGRSTAAALLALAAAARPGDAPVVAKARAFLGALQSDEQEGYKQADRCYGGIGYGDDERPDLFGLALALDALRAAGAKPGDAPCAKAVTFLNRCQNRLESNDFALLRGRTLLTRGADGGAGSAPGESPAGMDTLEDGALAPRSTGAATSALVRAYIAAGVAPDDPRVAAARAWLAQHWSLDSEPGFQTGDAWRARAELFGYLHALSLGLAAAGQETVAGAEGAAHAWRAELAGRLVTLQGADGAWVNAGAADGGEKEPLRATALAVLALEAALPAGK